MSDLTASENELGKLLQRFVWADADKRKQMQEKYEVNVVPCNFYSTVPSIREIEDSFEYNEGSPPYENLDLFNLERMRQVVNELSKYSIEFNPDIEGEEDTAEKYFWGNSQYSYSDAMAYYSFVRMLKPQKIVEIGSGFSTLIAIEAVKKNGGGEIHCIEPYPRRFLKTNKSIQLHVKKAQEVSSDFLNQILGNGDILFIDSTHTVKAGSDCLHIYLRLLPKIKSNIYVHVHDVFLPFALPPKWMLEYHLYWTEQYLLCAFLLDNPKASILYGSTYAYEKCRADLDMMMNGKYRAGGASVWFKYMGASTRSQPGSMVNTVLDEEDSHRMWQE